DIKPALSGYINEALIMLNESAVPDDKVVHDIRVLMKKSRATMRLLLTQLDRISYDREYLTFREVGAILSLWRETSVHRKMLKDMKKRYPGVFLKLNANENISSLMKKPDMPEAIPSDTATNITKIRDILNKSRYRIRFHSLNQQDPKLLLLELEKTYTVIRDRFINARNDPKAANLHEFRKRAKDFLYQLYFFRPIKPQSIKSLEKKLDAMTQNLGKYNDLAVLIKTLGYKYSKESSDSAVDDLILIIRQEQDRYLLKVWPAAYRIFSPGQKLMNVMGFKLLAL
ncbi:MAG TPA: CHAD domain-containing protein, partial [Bacteroidales bacterium]|nr:CHAD domain-containing protein [Bacteroidales bacterium]